MRVLELFAGIGACSKALERLGIKHEIADAVEIDKYAVKSFNAVHDTNFEPQDICEWDKDIAVDLIMHGSPCQDFSIAGKQAGGDLGTGTRSSLMYETLRIVKKLKPKYVIWENVPNILSAKHKHNFDTYIKSMDALGYASHYAILNAKDFGVPQNRKRVYTVSILDDREFEFPKAEPLTKKLADMLESEVDEKYYLSDKQASKFKVREISQTIRTGGRGSFDRHAWDIIKVGDLDIKGNDQIKRVYSDRGVSPTLSTMQGGNRQPKIIASRGRYREDGTIEQHFEPRKDGLTNSLTTVQKDNYVAIKTANKKGYDEATVGDCVNLAYPESKTRRGRVGHSIAQTLTTSDNVGVVEPVIMGSTQKHATVSRDGVVPTLTSAMGEGGGHVPMHNYDLRIRKLTPKECWRLMGFDDEDFARAEKVNSNTQLYKQAGNSIVVNVLESILKNLLKDDSKDDQ